MKTNKNTKEILAKQIIFYFEMSLDSYEEKIKTIMEMIRWKPII